MSTSSRLRSTVVALGCLLCASGCKRSASGPLHRARFQRPELLWKQTLDITTAVQLRAGLALGTATGGLALVDGAGALRWLLDPHAAGPTSNATSRPTPPHHRGGVRALDVSDDGERLLSVGGNVIAWWRLPSLALGRQLRGPQRIVTARFEADGKSALFGTDQGHVLRWALDQGEATALPAMGCGARFVDVFRRGLPESERCPFGTYGENKKGQPYCAYPVTQLTRREATWARACRTGTLSVFAAGAVAPIHYNLAGALADLRFASDDELLLTREDGAIARFLFRAGREADARRKGRPEPVCSCTKGDLFAVGGGREIVLWHRQQGTSLGGVQVPAPAVWIELSRVDAQGGVLEALLASGQRLRWRFSLEVAPREPTAQA